MGKLFISHVRNVRKCARRQVAGGATALLAALLLTGTAAVGQTPWAARPAAADTPDPISLAVAVDESSSLSGPDVERERDAAQRIALSEISPASRLTVFGFASADDDAQRAVDEVCPTTTMSEVAREKLGTCIGRLDRRGPGKGTGTDFPAAIRQGIARLAEGTASAPRILFLLTDGVLDVSSSKAYGDDKQSRQANGERELTRALAEARAARVQIWPLGFGDVDAAALRAMAAGGYQGACVDLPQAKPASRTVGDSAALGDAVHKAFASARCLISDPTHQDTPPATFRLRISPLATLATIVVSKGDPEVKVRIRAPGGKEIAGSGDDGVSSYELTGTDQEVESLRIVAPRPGTWTVHLTAPEGHGGKLASVGVQWRGALRSSIVMTPASPRPGERATVGLQLQTWNNRPVADPADLEVLKVSASLEGDGFTRQAVRLSDDGQDGDTRAGDGRFTGTVTIPSAAKGSLKVVGVLTAIGLTADHRPFVTGVTPVNPDVQAHLGVSDATVHPGGRVSVTLKASDDSTTARTLRLALEDTTRGDLTVTPARVRLTPGQTRTVQAQVRVGSDVSPGRFSAKIVVYDTARSARVLDARLLTVRVTPEPTWPQKHAVLLIVLGLFLTACAAFAGWRLLESRRVHDVRGLVLTLLVPDGEGQQDRQVSTLTVKTSGPEYCFAVLTGQGSDPRLVPDRRGPYAVRRDAQRMARLRTPGNSAGTRVDHGKSAPLSDGLRLRIDSAGGRTGRTRGTGGTRGTVGTQRRPASAGGRWPFARPGPSAPRTPHRGEDTPAARRTDRVPASGAERPYDPDL
ncbi:vWA domain-containing protein [Streptomyces sp. NPDC005811]|uniref:vWA domain-containing protein n=1 Tax=Streptomyces sp. NPDC005811 TaxID=3154565 RepID=UPI0033E79ECA